MENKTIIIAVVVILVVVLGLPAMMSATKGGASTGAPKSADTAEKPSAPEPVVPDIPPTLNAANLAGSQWQVPIDGGSITVTLNGGGQATSTAPPKYAAIVKQLTGSDVIQGQWSVNGGTLTVTASAMGRTETVDCKIAGDQIYYKGNPATRVR